MGLPPIRESLENVIPSNPDAFAYSNGGGVDKGDTRVGTPAGLQICGEGNKE